ncbi:gliding motility protein [Streptomyces sp. NPDC002054]|uniref:gliding motility protein n=1 Tax=Streptomyces sp. NPDC002054 TaxID=3154663 RepID=UPI00332C9EC8
MGVFDRFRRRKDRASTEVAEESAAGAVTAEAPQAAAAESGAETKSGTEPAAVEGVEIPKQQSAEAAADSEAGEGARR